MDKNNPNPRRAELESLDAVRERLGMPDPQWHTVVVQCVDLRSLDAQLSRAPLGGAHFLGCDIGPEAAKVIAQSETSADPTRRCMVFPRMGWLPFDPYRARLYSPEELVGRFTGNDPAMQDPIYRASVDWQSYISFADPKDTRPFTNDSIDVVMARRLHDTSIADALEDLLQPIRERVKGAKAGIVAFMGGHDMPRQQKLAGAAPGKPLGADEWEGMSDDATYARVALLCWRLTTANYLVVSGGGPGAMEAANLGAYFASRTIRELRAAIDILASFREFQTGKSTEWLIPAMQVRRDFPPGDEVVCQSVGIPTWTYGHEPPNPFASHIAKYFENSVREEGLLAIATHGVIFAEGNAGTVQEIFQDACQNYYATYGSAAPMILFGQDYWDPPGMPVYVNDKRKKVFPLVRKLAEEKGFTHRLLVLDSLRDIFRAIAAFKV